MQPARSCCALIARGHTFRSSATLALAHNICVVRSAALGLSVLAAMAFCFAGTAVCQAATIFDYNVIVTGTFTAESHVQGTTFANNLVAVNNPDFAQSASAGTGDTLTVAGTISGSSSILERGAEYSISCERLGQG